MLKAIEHFSDDTDCSQRDQPVGADDGAGGAGGGDVRAAPGVRGRGPVRMRKGRERAGCKGKNSTPWIDRLRSGRPLLSRTSRSRPSFEGCSYTPLQVGRLGVNARGTEGGAVLQETRREKREAGLHARSWRPASSTLTPLCRLGGEAAVFSTLQEGGEGLVEVHAPEGRFPVWPDLCATARSPSLARRAPASWLGGRPVAHPRSRLC